MKKRSLVAAIAMLIVSALVLTTATYAWFASTSAVGVDTVQTSISATDGSLQISYDGSDWTKTTITQSDLTGVGNNNFASALTPVSYNSAAKSFMAASFTPNTTTIAATGSANAAHYTEYEFYLRANTASYPVVFTPTVTGTNNFTYAAITVTTNGQATVTKLYGPSDDSYKPVIATCSVVDANNNYIIDDNDTGYTSSMLGSDVAPTNDASFNYTLSSTALAVTTVKVQIWAEGQDSDCTGLLASAFNISLAINKQA